ncbi:MAG TPA: hypothetical protein VGG06_35985 [Thermoanaerobaculia bacterium]
MRAPRHAVLVSLLLAAPAGAAVDPGAHWCGTERAGVALAAAEHGYLARRLARERAGGRLPPKTHDTVRQVGQVAVFDDDGSLFIAPKRVDLQGASLQFLRRPKGLSAVRSELDFKAALGDRLGLGDDDSFLVHFPADFRFPFGEAVYDRVWVNSDGNLTFGGPDAQPTARSPARFLDGPPRIAPLFADLDPSAAAGEGGVYLQFLPERVRFTWLAVPEFGTANRNTVQVTLFTTGRVTFVYGAEVDAAEAIVGANPFAGAEPLHLMDYHVELPFRPERVAIAEWFPAAGPLLDRLSIGLRFLQHYRDVHDQLVVWYAFPMSLGEGVLGRATALKNDVAGIGEDVFDLSDLAGSAGRLQALVEMAGSVVDYPVDPDERKFRGGESTMSLVGHEVGHRWLARLRYRDARDGRIQTALLGRDQSHWSFYLDSDASLMEGNEIVDRGDGSFHTVAPVAVRYSALDQYAMGLIPAAAVPPFFFVASPLSGIDTGANPRGGLSFRGERQDVTIADVIAAEGARAPPWVDAPKVFRAAFVLVGPPGEKTPEAAAARLDAFRERFESFFREATAGNGRVTTNLVAR